MKRDPPPTPQQNDRSERAPLPLRVTAGLIIGGFAARLLLEGTGRPYSALVVILVGLLLSGTGAWLTARLPSHSSLGTRRWWLLLLLAIYVVWPQRRPLVAVQLLTLIGLAFLLSYQTTKSPIGPVFGRDALANLSIFVLSLALYIATTAPGLLPADSGEFQIATRLLGIAHPPGYPLYTLVGRLFVLLIPIGSAAYRLNLMSALLAAGTLTLLSAATRHWAQRLGATQIAAQIGGLAAALTLGTATTFWAQAGTANIRMPTVFFAALGLYALARHATADIATDRWLGLLALALGLGLGHHPSLAFVGLFFLLYLLSIDPALLRQPRRWIKPALIVLLTLLPLLYVPVRGAADPPLAPPHLDTLSGFWHHVTAQGFEGDMFAYANPQELPQRLALLPTLFQFQFPPILLVAAALGLLLLAWRDRRLLLLLSGGLILHTFVSITYRAPQTVEYLMPAYLPLALLVGLTVAWLCSKTSFRELATLFAAAILLTGLSNGLARAPSFFALARDRSTREAVTPLLERAPPDAIILADWHWATPLWYLQWVEGRRPDVEVQYVYPVAGQEYVDTWRDWIAAAPEGRPLLLTHAYDLPGYTLEPLGVGFWLHPRPYTQTPSRLTPLEATFENRVRLLGYKVDHSEIRPGQRLEITLAWQPSADLTDPPSFSLQLLGKKDRLWARADRYLGTAYTSGETRFERLVLPLYPDLPPGTYHVALEVYSASEDGFRSWSLASGEIRLELARLSLQPRREPSPSLHPLSIPFSDGPTLVGVDYDRSVPGTLRLYLHWRGPASGEEQLQVGEVMAPLPTLPDGAYQTVVLDVPGDAQRQLTLTLNGVEGQVKQTAGPWGWSLRQARLPPPSATARFVPLGGEMALVGVKPAEKESAVPGETLKVRLDLVALQTLVEDYGVSVRLLDETGDLRGMHDLQPVLGAIPTLKWIRGTRVIDPHPIAVPADLSTRQVHATLVVYERFRGTPLPPLDGRMGLEVPLETWQVGSK